MTDPRTIQFYNENAESLTESYESANLTLWQKVVPLLPKGGKVLDIGCGSGRDLASLNQQGFDCWGIDPSKKLVKQAREMHPDLKNRIVESTFPPTDSKFSQTDFSLVSLVAVLMHVADEKLFECLNEVRKRLKQGGLLVLSCSLNRKGLDDTCRERGGRVFYERHPNAYHNLLDRLGFKLIHESHEDPDALGRKLHWFTQIYRFEGATRSRPVDVIASIIIQDAKTTTYKFALIRALAEIAQTDYRQVHVEADGKVAVPLGLITERWLGYYWPLVMSRDFIPQMRGERTAQKKIIFRKQLTEFAKAYPGGLVQFSHDFKSNTVPTAVHARLHRLVETIANKGIVKGPVQYSGDKDFSWKGSSSTQNKKAPFVSSKSALDGLGAVTLASEVWREFCSIGYWIREAIILRWAELSIEMDGPTAWLKLANVIEALLTPVLSERDQTFRSFFRDLPDLKCVWSGKSLRRDKFHLDHVIPFAHWHGNELWNLLPTHESVNSKKGAKLPSAKLLQSRKGVIVHYWKQIQEKYPARFNLELQRNLMVATANHSQEADLELAFSGLCETIELLALQKGIERWEG